MCMARAGRRMAVTRAARRRRPLHRARSAVGTTRWDAQRQSRPVMPSARGSRRRRRGQAVVGLGAERRGETTALRRRRLLRLARSRRDVLEGDGAFDFFASKDGLLVPANEDADVARGVGRHGGRPSETSACNSAATMRGQMQHFRTGALSYSGARCARQTKRAEVDGMRRWMGTRNATSWESGTRRKEMEEEVQAGGLAGSRMHQ